MTNETSISSATTAKKKYLHFDELPVPYYGQIIFGCDPEFFFSSNGSVKGAEKFIAKNGFRGGAMSLESKIIIDGVQAELNPRPYGCRANLGNEISRCFRALKEHLEKTKVAETTSLDFSQTVKISKKDLKELDEENQKFGCDPSLNSYSKEPNIELKKVDPQKYLKRSAGGHIHISCAGTTVLQNRATTLVTLLDIVLGNTCVLIDRDRGNIIRRKMYGQAGEYRLPKHGVEYRVLSNFWLRSAPLLSLVLGLTRYVTSMTMHEYHESYLKAFTDAVDIEDVRKAINTNNFALAYRNFRKIEPILEKTCQYTSFGLCHDVIPEFKFFVKKVKEHGNVSYYFPTDPMEYWCNVGDTHNQGFYAFFMKRVVRPQMLKEAELKIKKKTA